jgi:hypothetical protein
MSAKHFEIDHVADTRRAVSEQLGRPDDTHATDDAWLEAVWRELSAHLGEGGPRDTAAAAREESLLVIAVQALYAKYSGEKGDLLLAQELFSLVPELLDPGKQATDKSQTDKLRQKIYRLRGKYGVNKKWLAGTDVAEPERPVMPSSPSIAIPPGTPDPKSGNNFYIERPEDTKIAELAKATGNTLIICGPAGFGKSTLHRRYRAMCEQHGKLVVHIDLRAYTSGQLENLGEFLKATAANLKIDRNIARPIERAQDLTYLVEKEMLASQRAPVVLLIDHIDRLADYPYSEDVFAMLRHWHNNRGDFISDRWQRTDLVLVTAMSPTALMNDPTYSPFEVGQRITLSPFSLDDCMKLRDRLAAQDYLSDGDVAALHELVAGIPALVECAFQRLTKEQARDRPTWADLEQVAAEVPGPFGDYLLSWERRLEKAPEAGLEEMYRRFVSDKKPSWPRGHIRHLDRLLALGLVRLDNLGRPIPASPLHVRYFAKQA